jgi:hypothetical protein
MQPLEMAPKVPLLNDEPLSQIRLFSKGELSPGLHREPAFHSAADSAKVPKP